MEKKATNRGFYLYEFEDLYGENCSLQESSLATTEAIWLGVDDPKLTIFESENMGKYITSKMPENFSVSSRMHLSRKQVEEILPILTKFVETGEI